MNSSIHSAKSDRSAVLFRCLLLICLAVVMTLSMPAVHAESVPLNQHWEYRWGDSPFKDDTPVWTIEADEAQWHPISFPSNPPGRDGRENIWYRTLIPEGDWRDPVLYIFSVDLIVEVYLEGERIYRYGQFDAQGKGRFEGWPWHMIPLPENASGKPLYFRVYSNYMDIGLWGEVKIMDRLELYQQVLKQSIDSLIITAFSLLIATLALLFALFKSGRLTLLALSLFSLANAGLALSKSPAKQLLFNHALMWEYIGACSYYLLPIALALMLLAWFGQQLQWLYRSLAGLFLVYLIGALGLSLMGVVSLANTYPPFDLLFALLVPTMLLGTLHQLTHANSEQRTLLLATATLTLLLLVDMAVAHGWIAWSRIPVGWGSLLFSLAVVALSLRHFIQTQHALGQLNLTLENRVAERTQELKILARREADRVRALEFGNRKRVLLDDLINEMEACSGIDQATDLMLQHMPKLCEPLPGGLYQLHNTHWTQVSHWNSADLPLALLQEETLPCNAQWKPFRIEYDEPRGGRQHVALLLVDLDSRNVNFDPLNPLTLQTLFTRAIERINLTLSKIVLQQALSRFSYEDALTGLNNRRYLDDMLSRETALAQRNHTPLAVMICDIDRFKQLNDTYGHAAGDEVLKRVAELIQSTFRETDVICRFGGEEFVVVMPSATLQDCHDRAEQLRLRMADQTFTYGKESMGRVTLSAGISALNTGSDTADALLRRADNALYQAKTGGRNRVIRADTDAERQA